ncbi:hypothetical protein HDU96_001767 [Phlyctochytrium bullatum]|nr:hypothetical protein HDU96_001767 [Phlyctochytrium bullatum]
MVTYCRTSGRKTFDFELNAFGTIATVTMHNRDASSMPDHPQSMDVPHSAVATPVSNDNDLEEFLQMPSEATSDEMDSSLPPDEIHRQLTPEATPPRPRQEGQIVEPTPPQALGTEASHYANQEDQLVYAVGSKELEEYVEGIEYRSAVALVIIAVMKVLWQGSDWDDHLKRLFATRPNIKNIRTAAAKMLNNGTNVSALGNPNAEKIVENWPQVVDRRKPFKENVKLAYEYIKVHFRQKYNKNFVVHNITDLNAFPYPDKPRNSTNASPRKKRKIRLENDESEDKEDNDAQERIRDGL